MAYAPRALGLLLPLTLVLACATGADDGGPSSFGGSLPQGTGAAGSTDAELTTTGRPTTTDDDGTTGREITTTGFPPPSTDGPLTSDTGDTTSAIGDETSTGADESSSGEPVLCGNGMIDAPEECDGANLNAASCTSLGFTGGALVCTPQCIFDKSMCTSPSCGDGTVDPGEECDCGQQGTNCTAAQLGNALCLSLPSPVGGNYSAGELTCNSPGSCSFNKAACTYCGDGVRNGPEPCDGADLGGQTCQSQGFPAGSLSCSACALNTAGCSTCGNGLVDGGELCDGGNFNGQSCASVDPNKFAGGTLSCSAACNSIASNACNAGNCCVTGNAAACQVNAILNCVCNYDPFCCTNFWDAQCVNEAVGICGAQC